ncbi:MAG: NAD-binding protein, partial [Merdibacter sp.]
MKKNAIAVIGLGRFGMPLAKKLAEAGKEVIGVDMDEERVKEFREFSEYAFVAKKLSKEVLIEIGIQNCDMVAVCIGSKVETSILVTLN